MTSESPTELRVAWQPPQSFCMATSYLVQYELTYADQCTAVIVERVDYGVMYATFSVVTGLIPYSTYSVYVTAMNEAGDGPTMRAEALTLERGT